MKQAAKEGKTQDKTLYGTWLLFGHRHFVDFGWKFDSPSIYISVFLQPSKKQINTPYNLSSITV